MKENLENIKDLRLQDDITINAKITIQNRINKQGSVYQMLLIGVEDKETGEILTIHEIYIKENLRQIIEFVKRKNN